MVTHMTAWIDFPHVPWVRAVSDRRRIAEEIVVVILAEREVDDVLMSIREAILGRVWHSAILCPNDPIANDPSIFSCCKLDPSRDPNETTILETVTDI